MENEKTSVKDRILETAETLFAQKGYNGISIDEIARDAEINKSMIYYYFTNKEGLLVNVIQKHIEEFESIIKTLEITNSENMHDITKKIITMGLDYSLKNGNIMRILLYETLLSSPKAKIDVINFINPIWNKIESTLRAKFPKIGDIFVMDKLICINLIVNFILVLDRLDYNDEKEIQKMKDMYITRVTKILEILILKPEKS